MSRADYHDLLTDLSLSSSSLAHGALFAIGDLSDRLEAEEELRAEKIEECAKLRLVLREAFAVDARTVHQRMVDAANQYGLELERLFAKPEDFESGGQTGSR